MEQLYTWSHSVFTLSENEPELYFGCTNTNYTLHTLCASYKSDSLQWSHALAICVSECTECKECGFGFEAYAARKATTGLRDTVPVRSAHTL